MTTPHGVSRTSGQPSGRSPKTKRVVIVDDHHLVRVALKTLLIDVPELAVVAEADSVESGRRALVDHKPDVLVLDMHLPDGDGLLLCKDAAEASIPTAILTAFSGDELVTSAMMAGASGYLLKQDDPNEILTGVRTVAEGGAHFSTKVTPSLMSIVSGDAEFDDPYDGLTKRERELIELLGEGLSNRQIAERLFLGERTIKNYVSRLLRKLDMERRTEAAVFASKVATERRIRRYSVVGD